MGFSVGGSGRGGGEVGEGEERSSRDEGILCRTSLVSLCEQKMESVKGIYPIVLRLFGSQDMPRHTPLAIGVRLRQTSGGGGG